MPDLLEQGDAWLGQQRVASASRAVVLVRGAQSVGFNAALGLSKVELQEVSGVLEQYTARDFIVQAADLVLGGVRVLPQRGDRITLALAGANCTYEVAAPTGMECWDWSSPYKTAIRIHTKEVSA